MALIDLWKSNQAEFQNKPFENILGFVRPLGDGSDNDSELRIFLRSVPSKMLKHFASECLSKSFADSGFALQDVVNEIGRRMGYGVTFGRYRGTVNERAPDGIWIAANYEALIVEVKTTTAYTPDLERINSYSKQLGASFNGIVSTLIVVGRIDTAGWEAQVRGSRHAWDTRMISVDALVRLLDIRETIEDPVIFSKIRAILSPKEYTLVDEIVDLVFLTAEEVKEPEPVALESDEPNAAVGDSIPRDAPMSFHDECVARIESKLELTLTKQSRTRYIDQASESNYQISVSKLHSADTRPNYWFALHPHQVDFLEEGRDGFVVLGCGTESLIFLVPIGIAIMWLDRLHTTQTADGRLYWHIVILEKKDGWFLATKANFDPINLTEFRI